MNYAGCVGGRGLPVGFTASLWVPPNKLKLLKIRHALHEALHCNKSRSATQLPLRMQWPMALAEAEAAMSTSLLETCAQFSQFSNSH